MENGLNHSELSKLAIELEKFELITLKETGVKKFSGGFAIAEMFNYDEKIIDIELKWGIQDENGGDTHSEIYKMDRKTLKFLN
tara:strand:- start:2324 stop:2572 length:249 start_codon:yes stop_codon:yes gene_type:complete